MKTFCLLLLLLAPLLCGTTGAHAAPLAGAADADSLLHVLDHAIDCYPHYVEQREARIASLRQQLAGADTASIQYFRLNEALYGEYRSYMCDSAVRYLNLNMRWATRHGHFRQAEDMRIKLGYLLASAGLYEEASRLLARADRHRLDDRLLAGYYNTMRHLNLEMSLYSIDPVFRRRYTQRAALYDDSLMHILPPTSPLYLERQEMRASDSGDMQKALELNAVRLSEAGEGTPDYASLTYFRSQHYRYMGNREEQKRFLILSALADLRLAVNDHASLWNLAKLLYDEGDVERAYRYIRLSWDLTCRYNARSRSLQTAEIMPLISHSHQALADRQNARLRLYLVFISALTLLLGVAIAYIYRQMKRLSQARLSLEQANEQLSVSNRIKEEYVGRFMKLCSVYINRLDAYRRTVNKKITAGQTAELLKMVRSHDMVDDGLKDLYENFDSAFLHLFPTFVAQFNDLLRPEERITLREGELLNTELRIFALIRLGIGDSSQIAEFLHYSANTIYNYRARVKSKAAVPREEFEKRVMEIR